MLVSFHQPVIKNQIYLFWFLSLLQVFWQHRLCMRGQALKLHNSFLFISLISFIYQHYCSQKWLEPQNRYNRGGFSPISDMDFQFWAKWAAQEKNLQLWIMTYFWARISPCSTFNVKSRPLCRYYVITLSTLDKK